MAADLTAAWQRLYGIDVTAEFHGVEEIGRYRCLDTGLGFFYPRVEASAEIYEQLARFDWYYMADKWEYRRAIKDLGQCSRILEVGCGRGDFLRKLSGRPGMQVMGTELNLQAAAEARSAGFLVQGEGMDRLVSERRGYFDAVCAFQVLEHIAQPRPFIETCLALLKPGGLLVFCVPDCGGYLQHGRNILNLPPHHQLWWTKQSLLALQGIFPLRVKTVRYERLAEYHCDALFTIFKHRLLKATPLLAKLLFNRLAAPVLHQFLKMGRRMFRGQSIYAVLEKAA